MMQNIVLMSSLDSVEDDVLGFARRHNLTIEDRREYDEFGREDFECDRFEPSYLNVKFMDKQGMKVKVTFAYVD
jgi:hypothetical protein